MSSAAVVIGVLRVKIIKSGSKQNAMGSYNCHFVQHIT